MPSRYLSFRCSVPWLILVLQALLLLRSFFGFPGVSDTYSSSNSYPEFQDVNHMVIFGFGFFLMVLRRYGFSSTGFNFLLVVLGVQCSVLAEDLLVFLRGERNAAGLQSLAKAFVSVTAVVISTGAVLGRANPVQLIAMTLVELTFFYVSRYINETFLEVSEHLTGMHVFLFGAYFGLALASRFPEAPPGLDKDRSTPKSELFSVLGTVFVWVFWPSFNSILPYLKMQAVLNTYLALAVSAVAAFMLSALTSRDGKFRMRCFNPALKLQDTSGVHFTFGLPAVLGAVAAVVLAVVEDGIDTRWNELSRLGYDAFVYIGAFCQTISTALITGLITGQY
ncbi:hypothetical protein EK904_008381 [Melospiza melodia maxima]|nr:hypothetical protein EK904_008381 [Melospiza melodia maxima]